MDLTNNIADFKATAKAIMKNIENNNKKITSIYDSFCTSFNQIYFSISLVHESSANTAWLNNNAVTYSWKDW